MDQITDNVYLGNSSDAKNANLLQVNGIKSVLNVAIDLDYGKEWASQTFYDILPCKVGLIDGRGNSFDKFVLAVKTLNYLSDMGKVLIHCHEGRSRSPAVLAAFLACKDKISFDDALRSIWQKRQIVNPAPPLVDLGVKFVEKFSTPAKGE